MQYAPEVHARLAEARDLFAKGEANSALALIDQELALYPTSPIFLNEALQIALKIGASKKALSYARRVYKAEPYDLATMTNLAILEMQHGDLQAAARMLPYVAEAMPDNLSIQKWLGHALHETGALEEAAIAYEKAIQQPNQRQELLLPLAFVYRNVKRLPESNNLIEEYLESDPENLLARFSLGQNYLLLGDLPKGFRGYESHWLEKPELVAQLPCPLFQ
ncbi:MAG: tetratricopeptide repeat protein, partial [Alphaproteobacteria bacterium]|nr:tetratricopeptide repeat protein [Alphaproteobacteria bacterium]